MNLTELQTMQNNLTPNDLVFQGTLNGTQPIIGNLTGNLSATVHIIGMDDLIGLGTAILIFLILIFGIVAARFIYDLSDKRRKL